MTPRARFVVARRTVRRMLRASRMEDPTAARLEYCRAIVELHNAGAHGLFPAALRTHGATSGVAP